MKDVLNEETIGAISQKYFQAKGWETYPEVVIPIFGGRPDLVCAKHNLCLVAEAKMGLTFPVIEQLVRWHLDYEEAKQSTYRNLEPLAIPHLMVACVAGAKSRISGLKLDLLQRYRIGVVSIHDASGSRPYNESSIDIEHQGRKWCVLEEIAPKIQPGSRKTAHKIIAHLRADMRCATPGASGKVGGYMTPFKRTMGKTWQFIASHKVGAELHISSIVRFVNLNGGHHYTNDKGAYGGILSGLERDGIKHEWYRFKVPDLAVCQEMLAKYPTDAAENFCDESQKPLF